MGIYEFRMPDIGEGVAEGEIVSWKVAVGDEVIEDQDFVEVMTDKATVTITMPCDGVIKDLKFAEGDVVPVETVIAVIDQVGEASSGHEAKTAVAAASAGSATAVTVAGTGTAAPPAPARAAPSEARARPGRVLAAPATRRRAREQGVDLSLVPGSGPSGRVTNEDLAAYIEGGTPTAAPAVPVAAQAQTREPVVVPQPAVPGSEERVPFRGGRKKIAEAMTRSKFTATHFSVVEDVDVTELVKLRKEIKETYAEEGTRITFMPFFMKAVVAGLREFPSLNATLDESSEEIVLKHYYNLGIATDTDNGLIVPVVRDVDRKSIVQLARELNDLAARTREGKVNPEELKGGTFTITNAGAIGGLFATPIINFPEVAILGVHKIEKTPRVVGGEIRIRDVMYLSVSIDHRIVDGADGVRFLNVLKSCLEDPKRLLVEI